MFHVQKMLNLEVKENFRHQINILEFALVL